MNTFHIGLLDDSTLKRQLQLLILLYTNQEKRSFHELSFELNADVKTIQNDIKALSKKLPSTISFEIVNKAISLVFVDDLIIRGIITDVYKSSITCTLLLGIYHGDLKSFYEWADHFYLSYVHFRRKVAYINKMLATYNIKIAGSTFTLNGSEADIRYFYSRFFSNTTIFTFGLPDELYYDFSEFAIKQANDLGLAILNLDYHHTLTLFKVVGDRLKQNKTINLNLKLIKETQTRQTYLNFKQLLMTLLATTNLKDVDHIKFNEHEIIYMYYAMLDCIVYSDIKNENPLLIRGDESFELLSSFYHFVTDSLKALMIEKYQLKYARKLLQAFLTNLYHISKISTHYQLADKNIKPYVINKHKYLYEFWLTQTQKLNNLFNDQLVHSDDVAITLTMLTSIFLKNEYEQPYNILICFSGDPAYQAYLMASCQNRLYPGLRITYSFNSRITQTLLEQHKTDIVVTNFDMPIPIDNINYIRLSYLPTDQELDNLNDVLLGTKYHLNNL